MVEQYNHHVKSARMIAKELSKIGYTVHDPSDSESCGDNRDIDSSAVKYMKLAPPGDMNDH